MVEKIINIFKDNDLPLSQEQMQNLEKNKILHPDYQFIIWNKAMIDEAYNIFKLTDRSQTKFYIICLFGGFYIDPNYLFFKNIDFFLEYDFLAVYNNGKDIKFFGSKKNNDIIEKMIKKYGKFDELMFKYLAKIINPIYLYPELYSDYYTVVENNREYMFGANKVDCSWVFGPKLTGAKSQFTYNTKPYFFRSKKVYFKNTARKEILIVVAHPDDETLWFGNLLINNSEKIKVVCITNNSNSTRRSEFLNVMKTVGVDYEMWDISDFRTYADFQELKTLLAIEVKLHDVVYGNSLSGETGHPTHILLSKYLYDVTPNNLYVANTYNYNGTISPEKDSLLDIYKSQKSTESGCCGDIFDRYETDNLKGPITNYKWISAREDYLQIK